MMRLEPTTMTSKASLEETACLVCDEYFVPTRRGQAYCSPKCGARGRAREKLGYPIDDKTMGDFYRKITEEDLLVIEELIEDGCTQAVIAETWNVTAPAISRRLKRFKLSKKPDPGDKEPP